MKTLLVVGAGGHAKVVIATARAAGWEVAGLLDDDRELWGTSLLGMKVSGSSSAALEQTEHRVVLAIGSNAARQRLSAAARCEFATIVHPSAVIHETVQLGPGTVVFAGTVVQPDTIIGMHAIVNTGASIDHDCRLGNAVHVAPGVRLAGSVFLGDRVFVGIGAVLIPGVRVGDGSVIGAGAAVISEVSAGITVVGVPARPVR